MTHHQSVMVELEGVELEAVRDLPQLLELLTQVVVVVEALVEVVLLQMMVLLVEKEL